MATRNGKLRRRTMSEEIAHNLRNEIQRGALKPGTRLKQGEVSARLGASTTPVREAFALLQAEGFVTLDPYKGAIVFRPSIQEVRELYEIRQVLEALAIECAMTNMTDGDLLKLQRIIDKMRDTSDDERWLRLNHDLHRGIYEKSDRPRLCSLIKALRDASNTYLHMFISHADRSRAEDEHQQILDACKDRDSQRARKLLTAHLAHTLEVVTHCLSVSDETARTRS